VAQRHATRYALVPLLAVEPVGVQRLLQLSRPLSTNS
jgi:arsenite-transporting ATPase